MSSWTAPAEYLLIFDADIAVNCWKARIAIEKRENAEGSSSTYHGVDSSVDTRANVVEYETRKATKRSNRKDEIEKCRSAVRGAIGCYTRSNKLDSSVPSLASKDIIDLVCQKFDLNKYASSISSLLEQAGDPLLPFIQAEPQYWCYLSMMLFTYSGCFTASQNETWKQLIKMVIFFTCMLYYHGQCTPYLATWLAFKHDFRIAK